MSNSAVEIPWKRLTVEAGAIVVSILLAFSIDAWWDGIQEREDEDVILTTMLVEFQEIQKNIDDIKDYQGAILQSAYRLAEIAESPAEDIDEEEVNLLVEDQTWVASPENFAAPKLNAIIARGDISLVSNRDLRRRLLDLPQKMAWIRDAMQDDLDFSHEVLEPYLFRNSSYITLMNASTSRPGSTEFEFPEPTVKPRTQFSHVELVKNREFQNLMLQRTTILEDIISLARTPDLEQQIDDIVIIIERELE